MGVHPMIANPDFVDDEFVYKYNSFGVAAFEVWQVKAGTIFDNVFIGDDVEEAKAFAEATYAKTVGPEKEMYDSIKEEERKKEEEERKAAEDEEDEDEDEEEDEEEEPKKDEL